LVNSLSRIVSLNNCNAKDILAVKLCGDGVQSALEISKTKSQTKILLVGDDMRSFLACARSYGRQGFEVHAAPFNWAAPALFSKYVQQVHKLPRQGLDVNLWVTAVRDLQAVEHFDLIVPCDERALLPLCAVPTNQRNFRLADPGPRALEMLFDKARTRELAHQLGVPIAKGETIDQNSDAKALVEKYGLPLMLKARSSYSIEELETRGQVYVVPSQDELAFRLDCLPSAGQYLLESFFPAAGAADGVGLSVAARKGKILSAFQHRRLVEKPGGGSSSVRISEPIDAGMYDAVEKMCAATKLNGIAMFEFRQSVTTGEWVLLEVNARPWGSMPLPLALGIDFPMMFADIHLDVKRAYATDYKSGVVGKNLVLTLLHKLQGRGRANVGVIVSALNETIIHSVNCIRAKEVSDSFVFDDLKPAIFEFSALLRRGFDRILWQRKGRPERRHGVVVPQTMAQSSSVDIPKDRKQAS
jgi:predicted ATP-grasp superfamily ATP-dependent carboligase